MSKEIEYSKLAKKVEIYISTRRDSKVLKLLRDNPNKKGVGGINKKLIGLIIKKLGLLKFDKKSLESAIKKLVEMPTPDEHLLKQLDCALKIIGHKKTKEQSALPFELERHEKLLLLIKIFDLEVDYLPVIREFKELENKIFEEYAYDVFIDSLLLDAKKYQVCPATHVARLTNSTIQATSILDDSKIDKTAYLSTSSVSDRTVDGTYFDAKGSPSVKFLMLESNGVMLSSILSKNKYQAKEILAQFSSSNSQLEKWVDGFHNLLSQKNKSTHTLTKQVYFPVNSQQDDYHLLSILMSSSLAHEIFERFDKDYKKTTALKEKGKFSEETIIKYPNKAVIKVTQSRPQNSSILNGKRSGRIMLVSAMPPPIWKSILKPPINKVSLFYGEVNYKDEVTGKAKELQNMLLAIKLNKISINNPKTHSHLISLVEEISEELFKYVLSIQKLKGMVGWSEQADKLKLSHKLWLDPYRVDEEFQNKRKSGDWENEICNDFANWLNRRLEGKQLRLGTIRARLWRDIFTPKFKQFNELIEIVK